GGVAGGRRLVGGGRLVGVGRLVGRRGGSRGVRRVPLGLAHHGAVGGVPLVLAGVGVVHPLALGVLDALFELGVAARETLGELRLRADVDADAGEPGGQASVLALATDRQAQLVIGDDDVRLRAVVGHDDLGDLG